MPNQLKGSKKRTVLLKGENLGDKGFGFCRREGITSALFWGILLEDSEISVPPGEASQLAQLVLSQKVGSWVGAVQGKRVLTKFEVDVQMKDGVGTVDVPEEVMKDAAPLWEDFLIGKFLETATHIAKVHAIVNKIWAFSDKNQMIEVFEVNANTMKFRITNSEMRNRVLRRGMWNLAEVPVVMTKWTPFAEEKQVEIQSVPMWVHMKNVPMNMFSWKGLSFVSSPLGTPVRLHPETSQCLNLKEAKIFVNVDLTKKLPNKMKFSFQGKETMVAYSYPRLPIRCSTCEKWGHTAKVCLVNGGEKREGQHSDKSGEKKISEKDDKEMENSKEVSMEEGVTGILYLGEKSEEPSMEQEKEESMPSADNKGSRNVGEENGSSTSGEQLSVSVSPGTELGDVPGISEQASNEEVNQVSIGGCVELERKDVDKEKEWLEITPGKGCKSPGKQLHNSELGQAIVSNSRFSVLSLTEEEEEGEIVDTKEENGETVKQNGSSVKPEIGIQRQSVVVAAGIMFGGVVAATAGEQLRRIRAIVGDQLRRRGHHLHHIHSGGSCLLWLGEVWLSEKWFGDTSVGETWLGDKWLLVRCG
ncbi:hypothetical protein Bca101_004373 [Brassica carinata]